MKKILLVMIIIITLVGVGICGYYYFENNEKIVVSFNTNNDNKLDSIEIKKGESINLPILERYGYVFLGWFIDEKKIDNNYKFDKTSVITAKWEKKSNEKFALNIDMSTIDSIDNSGTLNCEKDVDGNCSIIIPMFNKKGYIPVGYSNNIGDNKVTINFGDKYTLTKTNETIYPVYIEYPEIKIPNLSSDYAITKAYVDVGYNCPSNIVNSYIDSMKKINGNWSFLFHYQKITLLNSNDIKNSIDGNLPGNAFTIKVKDYLNLSPTVAECSDRFNDIYLHMIHQLVHSMDNMYEKKYNKLASNEDDVKSLFNKYKNEKKYLQRYSYMNSSEFFADLLTFYYINYVDKNYVIKDTSKDTSYFYRNNYPDDMKNIAEKYLDIFKKM